MRHSHPAPRGPAQCSCTDPGKGVSMKTHVGKQYLDATPSLAQMSTVTSTESLLASDTASVAPRKRRRINLADTVTGYLFILPAIIGFVAFVAYPFIFSAYTALTDWNGITDPKYVAFKNFQYLFTKDPAFLPSLKATFIYGFMSVPLSLLLGLLLAVFLNRTFAGVSYVRTIMYLPVVLPAVAVLTLWKYLYDPQFGLANQILSWLHLPTSLWLGSEQMALPAIVLIQLWSIGGTTIIFLAGLQAVPQEIYEAAKLDGAGAFTLFTRITLPAISPILFLQLILQLVGAFQTFNQPKILTGGGPNFATDLFMYKIYSDAFGGIGFSQLGYATAEVWVLFLIIVITTLFTFRTSSMWVYTETNE